MEKSDKALTLFNIVNYLKLTLYKARYKVHKKQYGMVYKMLGIPYFNELQMANTIKECLQKKKPYCIGKIGGNEANALVYRYLGSRKQKKKAYERLCFYAGYFPKEYSYESLDAYIKIQADAISKLDMIVYYEKEYEEYVLRKFASDNLVWVDVVGSWSQDLHWTRELRGYKVVVVHPFAELIEKQYENRLKIYPNSDVLPEFELRVVKAVQTIADSGDGGFSTWSDALNYMFNEVMSKDFDIALIGCGAYGLPLAAKVKDAGKIGVHMGGDLQMLFGIRGKRWDDRDMAKRWFNEAWVRPSSEYKVGGYGKIEDGCYW